jgi:hypothetical protein
MDTLFWTAFNPNIQLLETKKPMHGNCLYRLCIWANGSSLLRERDADLVELVKMRNQSRRYNPGGSWRMPRQITSDDTELLQIVKQARDAISDSVKVRIEDPCVQFYSADPQPLQDLATQLAYRDNGHFYSWMRPANPTSHAVLLEGKVIRKRPPKFQYKVIIRDGKFSDQTRTGLKNWLGHQSADEVHAPRALMNMLSSNHRFIWGGYIYINDLRNATFLGMIDPNLVAKIEEFHYSASDE